ncbi:MAG: glycosyltransferase [Dermatophilaceae bacterium]
MDPTTTAASVAVIIAAKDEAARIVATVSAARRIAGVDLVIVVDDGSSDATGRLAGDAGAVVLSHPRNRGKAAAMATGARAVADQDISDPAVSGRARLLLFIDADLEDSAANTAVLVAPVASGEADMTIAILPPQSTSGGGHGFVVRLARNGIERLTGWTPTQPLSGMRALSRGAFEAASPLARGWGVEVGLTIDVLGAGLRVAEVPCELQHRVTGSSWRGQAHRARQYRDVWLALAYRRARRRTDLSEAESRKGVSASDKYLAWLRPVALTLSFALLLLVAAAGPSAAKPGLGPHGWAPGDLPVSLSSAVVTAVLWTAYLLGAVAVALGLWRGSGSDQGSPLSRSWFGSWPRLWSGAWPRLWSGAWPLALGALALVTAPIGSADHTNYAAYGRIAAQGGDPYLIPPITWALGGDPVTNAVEPPWTMTPSVYGPFGTALQALSSLVGQDNLRQTVWVWQLFIVAAWLLVRLVLRHAAADGSTRARVDLLWTANPLVFGIVVLGAHVDLIATALALGAVVLAARRPWIAGLVLGAAVSTKITYGIVGLAIVWSWRSLTRKPLVRNMIALAVSFTPVVVFLHLWAGPHVFEQLLKARKGVSLATAWRPVVNLLSTLMPLDTARAVVSVASVVTIVVLVWVLSRLALSRATTQQALTTGQTSLTRQVWSTQQTQSAMTATFVLAAAYAVAAPYALPWYDALVWATLPLMLATTLDGILLARLTVMAMAYVPGRVVAMSPDVESVTLGFRKVVGPLAAWLVLLAIAVVVRRGWSRAPRTSLPRVS